MNNKKLMIFISIFSLNLISNHALSKDIDINDVLSKIDFSKIKLPSIDIKISADSLKTVFEESGDVVVKNIDKIFVQLGKSMPKVGEGMGESFIKMNNGIAQSMKPIRKEFAAGVFTTFGQACLLSLISFATKKSIEKYFLFKPKLVQESSSFFSNLLRKEKNISNINDHMIINEKLKNDLNYIMKMTKNIKQHGGQFENILFYGLPGTGKTLFAKLLAEYANMDYAIIPAANVSQFLTNNSAVSELNNLFNWAAKSKKGTILFFDESETFLANRSSLKIEAQNALNSFLAITGTPSDKIMVICATNRPEVLDEAVLSRLSLRIEFPLPDLTERVKQINMHVDKIFKNQKGSCVNYELLKNPITINNLAQSFEGLSGRTIQQLISRTRQLALAEDNLKINQEIINRILTSPRSIK